MNPLDLKAKIKLPKILIKRALNFGENILSNGHYKLSCIIEDQDWYIKRFGEEIIKYLEKENKIKARISPTYFGIKNQVIHFTSANTYLRKNGFAKPHSSNKTILTWFHVVPEDKKNKNIIEAQKYLDILHVPCNITKREIIKLGVKEEKIIVIPFGIDSPIFKRVSSPEKEKIRKELGIPLDRIVFGSFQKDGVGWGDGMEPKLIKGPDIFVALMEKLSKDFPVFVLLTGPSRGYVKSNLQKKGIPFKDMGYFKDFSQIGKYYNAIDIYPVTSRIEGGPQQILEAMASGIPVLSTKMGIAVDVINAGENGFLAEVEDVEGLAERAKDLINNPELREKIIENGLETAKNYGWERIVKRYYSDIYSKLI